MITVGRDLVETVEKRFNGKKVPKTVMINNWIDENEIYPLDENNEKFWTFKKNTAWMASLSSCILVTLVYTMTSKS